MMKMRKSPMAEISCVGMSGTPLGAMASGGKMTPKWLWVGLP